MSTLRFDHVGIVVRDIDAAIPFFLELGMVLDGEAVIQDTWAERVSNLKNLNCKIAMLKTEDGSGRIELAQYISPDVLEPQPSMAPANTLGYRSVMFEVDDLHTMVERLHTLGATLVGEITEFEQSYRLCYLRGPEGIIVALAESLTR